VYVEQTAVLVDAVELALSAIVVELVHAQG
jgi:hypothetical protein